MVNRIPLELHHVSLLTVSMLASGVAVDMKASPKTLKQRLCFCLFVFCLFSILPFAKRKDTESTFRMHTSFAHYSPIMQSTENGGPSAIIVGDLI